MFDSLEEQPRRPVEVGEGQLVDVRGIGRVRGTASVDGEKQEVVMKEVLYVPTMICNLISVSKTRQSGFKVMFDGDKQDNGYCEITHKPTAKVYLRGIELNEGLYEAVFRPHQKPMAFVSSQLKQETWHKRLAHVSHGVMAKTQPIVNGLDLPRLTNASDAKCNDCEVSKSCRKPRPRATEESQKSTAPLELVHADIVGPMKYPSLRGKRYFLPVYDDNSAASLVRFLRSRDEVGAAIQERILDLETMRNNTVKHLSITMYEQGRVKRLRTDNAKELLSKNFTKWVQSKGIHHELSSAYSPESNGKAERLNRTLLDMARTMLLSAPHLPDHRKMWAESINAACYIRNRLFSSACTDPTKTPYQVLLNKKPDLSHICMFGSKGYVHIPKTRRKDKFAERAQVGYVVGFERGNSYRVYIPGTGKVVVSRDVTIDETVFNGQKAGIIDESASDPKSVEFDDPFESFRSSDDRDQGAPSSAAEHSTPAPNLAHDDEISTLRNQIPSSVDENENQATESTSQDAVESLTHYPEVRRSVRETKPPERYGYDTTMLVQQAILNNEDAKSPLTFQEAVSGPEREAWKAAMNEEVQQFEKKKTWKLVNLPEGARAVKNKWVYFCKLDKHGKLKRRRARLVAKGFSQQKGVDYDDIFASVAKYSTVRMLLAFAVQEDLEMLLVDVKTAFLNGELEETIFMEQPKGFVVKGKEGMVYQLLKAIYGLKQASRAWRKLVNAFLHALGCQQSKAGSSLYFLVFDGETVYILVYVDDF